LENNGWMPCMNCPMMNHMGQQPMMQQPMMMEEPDMEEEELKTMYPNIHGKLMPMIKHSCDNHEAMHGKMHCPRHEDIKDMSDEIYKGIEADLDEDFGEDEDDESRIRRYGRGNAVRDLIGILLLNEFIGRRRRRRRRRPRPHYGWY
jgi:hypothetical protein